MKITRQHYAFYMRKKNPIPAPSWAKAEWEPDSNIHALINLQAPDNRDYGFHINNLMVCLRRHTKDQKDLVQFIMRYSNGTHTPAKRVCRRIMEKIFKNECDKLLEEYEKHFSGVSGRGI